MRGIAIYVDNKLSTQYIDDLTEFDEGILINITSNKNYLILCRVHRGLNSKLGNDYKLFNSIKMLNKKYSENHVIIGNFNYPNIKWYDMSMEVSAKELNVNSEYKFIKCLQNNFLLQNVTKPTCLRTYQVAYILNLIITKGDFINNINYDDLIGNSD